MRDFNQELKARNKFYNIIDEVLVVLGFVGMFLLLFWMACTI